MAGWKESVNAAPREGIIEGQGGSLEVCTGRAAGEDALAGTLSSGTFGNKKPGRGRVKKERKTKGIKRLVVGGVIS